jgi:DNA-binding beta-propeller fold protein YncE
VALDPIDASRCLRRVAPPGRRNAIALPGVEASQNGSEGMDRRTLGLWMVAGIAGCGGAAPAAVAPWVAPVRSDATAEAQAPAREAVQASRCARRRPGVGAVRAGAGRRGGATALARLGASTIAYAADADDDAIHTVDVDRAVEIAVTPLGGSPAELLVLADGRVAATLSDTNRVVVLEPGERPDAPLETLCEAAMPSEPWGLAATPDDARLVVTSAWARALSVIDAGSLDLVRRVRLDREPRGVLVGGDGRRAFVTHLVGARMSIVDLADPGAPVHAVDLRPTDARGQPGTQGYALVDVEVEAGAPGRILAPLTGVDPGKPEASSSYGGTIDTITTVPMVSVVDPVAERVVGGSHRVDATDHRRGCLLPRAADVTPAGTVLVACRGIDALVELDGRSLDPPALERRRFRVPAGPSGVAVDAAGDRAIVWSQFAREVAVVDLAASPADVIRIPVARRQASRLGPAEERGRAIFHATDDPRISRDGRACASCHPEGREDALTWSTPEGPRQTIMLAGRISGSAPYGWFGKHRTVRDHVTSTLARLGGAGLSAPADRADLDALLAYVSAMRPPSLEGAAEDAGHAALAAEGRAVFLDPAVGCARCHLDGGTDQAAHDVKSGNVVEASVRFDTPSLRFVGGTAPYFHDGRYATLEELLEKSDGRMGHTQNLSRADLLALAAYLEDL